MARPSFPLPQGYFGVDARLSTEQEAHFRRVAQTQIDAILRAEQTFAQAQRGQVNTRKWRLARKEHRLSVFRRRTSSLGLADAHAFTGLLSVGQVDESMDALLHGLRNATHEEFQATMTYMDANNRDSAVLHTIELEQPDDATHYLGLKWTLSRLPSTILAKPRDWCFLEALGTSTDKDGKRFGYLIMHSVDVPCCPPFDERAAVRAKGEFAFILREVEPGTTDVYAQGLYDPAGDLTPAISAALTSDIFLRLSKTSQCSEAKRLTMMAVRNYTTATNDAEVHRLQPLCSICVKGGGMFAALKMCNVCGATVCAKCRVKKLVFTGVDSSLCEILCCKTCILEANTLDVHPTNDTFVLANSEQRRLTRETIWRGTHQWGTSSETTDEDARSVGQHSDLHSTPDHDTSSLRDAQDDELDKIIDDMMERKALSKSQRGYATASKRAEPAAYTFSQSVSWDKLDATSSPISPDYREPYPTRNMPPPPTTPREELYLRMLALQTAAHQAYAITKANEQMMRKL